MTLRYFSYCILAGIVALVAITKKGRASEPFPVRPITIVVGFAPGGSSDTGARLLAERLSRRLGQPVLIENRPGAGGMLGTAQALQRPADGYTLIFLASAHTVTAALKQGLPFDAVEDLEWLSTVATYAMVFGVLPNAPYKSLEEFMTAAKSKPRTFTYYSVGHGTGHHLLGEWLNSATGAEISHVPYRGSSAAWGDFVSGRVDLMIDTMTFAHPQILAGTVRPLAVTSRRVPSELVSVPFSADIVPGLQYESWLGVAARKGTPPAIVERLRQEIVAIVGSQDFGEDMRRIGAYATARSGQEFKAQIVNEIADFGRVIAARKIEAQ